MKILGMGFPELLILLIPVIAIIIIAIVVAVSNSNKGKSAQPPVTLLQQPQQSAPNVPIAMGNNQGNGQASGSFCIKCGTALEPGDKFCPKCGNTNA